MKSIKNILMAAILLLSSSAINAQIKNLKTETVTIQGNCGMCKKTIEKAGNLKNTALVDWNADTEIASISYDVKKTNKEEILTRIALVGYDSDSFLAPDDVYNNLPGCCQYERVNKIQVVEKSKEETESIVKLVQEEKPLTTVLNTYFELKDALVQTDSKLASEKADALLASIEKVDMSTLEMDVHMIWMKVLKPLKENAKAISDSKNVENQRKQFSTLSDEMYKIMKVLKLGDTVFFQHCPMANNGEGANWLSKEEKIKNPYYGEKMLSCGKTVETIK